MDYKSLHGNVFEECPRKAADFIDKLSELSEVRDKDIISF